MDEENGLKEVQTGEERNQNEEIFTKIIRAGRRTYFFDVKATRNDDYYLTVTESKKRLGKDGKYFYEKHKIFLYKEDFEKFMEGLNESLEYIGTEAPQHETSIPDTQGNKIPVSESGSSEEFTDIEFDDLGKK